MSYLNELLFKAFEISSLIWLFHKREDMLNFFCEKVSELRNCAGVVLKDTTGIYGKISGDLLTCLSALKGEGSRHGNTQTGRLAVDRIRVGQRSIRSEGMPQSIIDRKLEIGNKTVSVSYI